MFLKVWPRLDHERLTVEECVPETLWFTNVSVLFLLKREVCMKFSQAETSTKTRCACLAHLKDWELSHQNEGIFSREKRLGPRELVNICYFSMHCPARHRLCSFTGMTKEQVSDLVTEESCRSVPTAAEFNSITLAVSAGVVARSRICAWQPSVCIEQVRESIVRLCHVVSFILKTYKLVQVELERESENLPR